MTQKTLLLNQNIVKIKWCSTFWTKLQGFMFRAAVNPDEGLVISEAYESILNSSIHMFFVGCDLSVFWLDHNFVVVDKVLAKSWAPFYRSTVPAMYVLELHHKLIDTIQIGTKLVFENA